MSCIFCSYRSGEVSEDSLYVLNHQFQSDDEWLVELNVYNFLRSGSIERLIISTLEDVQSARVVRVTYIPMRVIAEIHKCSDREEASEEVQLSVRGPAPKTVKDMKKWELAIRRTVGQVDRLQETRGRPKSSELFRRMVDEVLLRLKTKKSTKKCAVATALSVTEKQIGYAHKQQGIKKWEDFIDLMRATVDAAPHSRQE